MSGGSGRKEETSPSPLLHPAETLAPGGADKVWTDGPLAGDGVARAILAAVGAHVRQLISFHEPDGRFLYASAACKRLLGYEPPDLHGRRIHSLLHPDDLTGIVKRRPGFPARGEAVTLIYRIQRRSGRYVWFETACRALYGADGKAFLVVAVSGTVEERNRVGLSVLRDNQRLRQVERDRLRLLNNIAHDLANALTPIGLRVATLAHHVPEGDQAGMRVLDGVRHGLDRLSRFLLDLRDLGHVQAGRLRLARRPTSIQSVVEGSRILVVPLAQARSVGVFVERGPNPRVLADGVRVQQVLVNLLSNAIRFSREGGEVRVRVEADGEDARVSVQDQGRGLSPDEAGRVFEPYVQVHDPGEGGMGGTGLGLAIARDIVQAHGGRLTVESAGHGRGSTFTFTLPLAE